MKIAKKAIAICVIAIMMLSIAPLNGFVGIEFPKIKLPDLSGLFASKVSAESGEFYTSGYCGVKCDEYPNGDNISWSITDEGVLTLTGTGEMEESYFSTDLRIKQVVIGNGIQNVSNNAFFNCSNIESVIASMSVKKNRR